MWYWLILLEQIGYEKWIKYYKDKLVLRKEIIILEFTKISGTVRKLVENLVFPDIHALNERIIGTRGKSKIKKSKSAPQTNPRLKDPIELTKTGFISFFYTYDVDLNVDLKEWENFNNLKILIGFCGENFFWEVIFFKKMTPIVYSVMKFDNFNNNSACKTICLG